MATALLQVAREEIAIIAKCAPGPAISAAGSGAAISHSGGAAMANAVRTGSYNQHPNNRVGILFVLTMK